MKTRGNEGGRWEIRDGKRVLVHRGACDRHPEHEVIARQQDTPARRAKKKEA